jgi:hypothetical protein
MVAWPAVGQSRQALIKVEYVFVLIEAGEQLLDELARVAADAAQPARRLHSEHVDADSHSFTPRF